MVARLAVTAAAVVAAVHSFTPVVATADTTITAAPSKRTPTHHDIAKRQTTYETNSPLPLTDYIYPYSAVPYQVNPYPVLRGPQTGYNRCNSSTENQDSQCQTAVVNDLTDFCLWGSPTTMSTIGDIEAQVVAYCSKAGHGTRLISGGAIYGAQFTKTPAYIQVVGWIHNSGLNLTADDYGGELDPHGADLLGNPLGGLMYSSNLPKSSQGNTLVPVNSWNSFVGSDMFCMKICDPSITSPNYCENRFDLLGCEYNAPANYDAIKNTFTSCEGDVQDVVGTYVQNGQTLTYSQPASLVDPPPYTPRTPSSSNCQTFSSAQLYSNAAIGTAGVSSSTAAGTGSMTTTAGGSKSTGTSGGSKTSTGSGNAATGSSAASPKTVIAGSGVFAFLSAVVMML